MSGHPIGLAADLSALPQPEVDGEWRDYWEGATRGELLIQHCPACGHRQFYPRGLCTACGATPEWLVCSGRGTVHTFTVIRQNLVPPFKAMLPYVVASIALDEGVRMIGNVIGIAADAVHIDLAVKVHFVPVREGLTVPYWVPDEGDGRGTL